MDLSWAHVVLVRRWERERERERVSGEEGFMELTTVRIAELFAHKGCV